MRSKVQAFREAFAIEDRSLVARHCNRTAALAAIHNRMSGMPESTQSDILMQALRTSLTGGEVPSRDKLEEGEALELLVLLLKP